MNRSLILIAAMVAAGFPGRGAALPPEPVLRSAIESSPSLDIAEAMLARAEAEATRLRVGDYEVVASGGAGQRRLDVLPDGVDRFTEWNVGVSRKIRMPNKRSMDQERARLTLELAEVQLQQARQEAWLDFVSLWSDWRLASESAALSLRLAADAERLAEAESRAAEKGGSRAYIVEQLRAEAALRRLDAQGADLDAREARAMLSARFPELALPERAEGLPADKIVSPSIDVAGLVLPAVRAAQLADELSTINAKRSRADQLPDPTVGLAFSNEFGGEETSLMANLSIPLGGRARRAQADARESDAAVAAARLVRARRDAERQLLTASRAAALSAERFRRADEASALANRAVGRLEEGRRLGAVDLTELIAARRTFVIAEQALVEHRIEAERALETLIVLSEGDPARSLAELGER